MILRYLAYSAVTLLTVTAPGQSLATGVLLVTLSGLRELSRGAAQLRCCSRAKRADSLLRRLPFDLK